MNWFWKAREIVYGHRQEHALDGFVLGEVPHIERTLSDEDAEQLVVKVHTYQGVCPLCCRPLTAYERVALLEPDLPESDRESPTGGNTGGF